MAGSQQRLHDSLASAVTQWRTRSVETGTSAPWRDASDVTEYAMSCVARAEAHVASTSEAKSPAPDIGWFCVVTKAPHAVSGNSIIAIISRLIAFGVRIGRITRLPSGEAVARALYPTAYSYFREPPTDPAVWDAISQRFDTPKFEQVFGERFSRALVVPGRHVLREYGLAPTELREMWEEGRTPITRDLVRERYGRRVADQVLGGRDSYDWFRGQWPFGIQRITSGVMAFAMKHERLHGGHPIVVLNGHFLGLVDLFVAGATLVEAGTDDQGPSIGAIRQMVVGADNRPSHCLPGTIRRDALAGSFPVDSPEEVSSRRNVVHCSDGLLAGLIERRALLSRETAGAIREQLRRRGLTEEELWSLVLEDPVVDVGDSRRRLTELTRELGIDETVVTIARVVPPVFGQANGSGSGLSLPCLAREFDRLLADGSPASYSHRDSEVRDLTADPLRVSEIGPEVRNVGVDLIRRGSVALVVPAGGTGGRFGSYDLPESDPRRQKALARVFTVGGRLCSGLDVRVANAAYWRARTGGRLPVAVMASPTNRQSIDDWCAEQRSHGVQDLDSYQQFGTYRLRADLVQTGSPGRGVRWVDAILRSRDGTPSLKPPGNLGTLTCLASSGILDRWIGQGVEIIVIANGDDVAFRLDPAVVGLLRDPGIDAVAIGAAWGLRGIAAREGRLRVRADLSGWCVTDTGDPGTLLTPASGSSWQVQVGGRVHELERVELDRGGSICEISIGGEWRVAIAETAEPGNFGSKPPLYSTNQMYIRVSALRRAMGLPVGGPHLAAIESFVAAQPFYAERKAVYLDGERIDALQLSQGANDVLRHLKVQPVLLQRAGGLAQRGGFAAVKRQEDVIVAQRILDNLAAGPNQLSFAAGVSQSTT